MKIKDVETKVGISSANIRYYEKEGLISPERNNENNYREYSEKDIAHLKRIKVLRILGVPISDIRKLTDGNAALDSVMAERLASLSEEEKNLEAVRRVCENLQQGGLAYDDVTEDMLTESETYWRERLTNILSEDITKEILSPEQFNRSLALTLSWGYIICMIVSFFFGNWLLSYEGDLTFPEGIFGGATLMQEAFPIAISYKSIFFIPIILSVVCYIAMYFTADILAQTILFHVSALILSPVTAALYMYLRKIVTLNNPANTSVNGMHFGIFWLMIAVYVLILFLLSRTWDLFFTKARYILLTALIYTAVMTLLAGTLGGLWTVTGIGFLTFTLYIGLNWFHAHQTADGCSRYYAVTEGSRIMNLFGVVFHMRGKTRGPLVYR